MRVFAQTSLSKSATVRLSENNLPTYVAYRYAEDLRFVARCRPAAFSARRAGNAGFLGIWRGGANVAAAQVFEFIGLHD